MKNKNKKKSNWSIAIISVFAVIICISVISYIPVLQRKSDENEFNQISEVDLASNSEVKHTDDWRLILVNKENPISSDFKIDLTEFTKGHYCDSRVTQHLKEMMNDASKQNNPLFIASSYRSVQRQEQLYKQTFNNNIKAGLTNEQAKEKTEQYQAPPGTSEHGTGLAFDIVGGSWFNTHNDLTDDFDQTETFKWLNENAHKYGFILRYQKDKEDITGYSYEPWHFRYVGKEVADVIKSNNICLEEYLNDYL